MRSPESEPKEMLLPCGVIRLPPTLPTGAAPAAALGSPRSSRLRQDPNRRPSSLHEAKPSAEGPWWAASDELLTLPLIWGDPKQPPLDLFDIDEASLSPITDVCFEKFVGANNGATLEYFGADGAAATHGGIDVGAGWITGEMRTEIERQWVLGRDI